MKTHFLMLLSLLLIACEASPESKIEEQGWKVETSADEFTDKVSVFAELESINNEMALPIAVLAISCSEKSAPQFTIFWNQSTKTTSSEIPGITRAITLARYDDKDVVELAAKTVLSASDTHLIINNDLFLKNIVAAERLRLRANGRDYNIIDAEFALQGTVSALNEFAEGCPQTKLAINNAQNR